MELSAHPDRPDFLVGPEVLDTRDRPPPPTEAERVALYGLAPGDWELRLYHIPARTSVEELIEFFEVGTHGAVAQGWDERDTMDLVGRALYEVAAIVPGQIELASPAALRFRFARRLRQDELEDIEAVYHRVDELQAGLLPYLDGWSGESLLAPLLEAAVLELRWD